MTTTTTRTELEALEFELIEMRSAIEAARTGVMADMMERIEELLAEIREAQSATAAA